MIPVPRMLWQWQIRKSAKATDLSFMSEEHHLVHEFVVRELPNVREPLSPEFIAEQVTLPATTVESILEDLDEHMTFVCRNEGEAVIWAYPVTAAATPHQVTFSTGEQVHAA
jgi:hypothetical protein